MVSCKITLVWFWMKSEQKYSKEHRTLTAECPGPNTVMYPGRCRRSSGHGQKTLPTVPILLPLCLEEKVVIVTLVLVPVLFMFGHEEVKPLGERKRKNTCHSVLHSEDNRDASVLRTWYSTKIKLLIFYCYLYVVTYVIIKKKKMMRRTTTRDICLISQAVYQFYCHF